MTPDRLLYDQAHKAMDVARQDWIDADAEAGLMYRDKQLYRAAIDARFEAAKRWTAASVEIRRYEELSEALARQSLTGRKC